MDTRVLCLFVVCVCQTAVANEAPVGALCRPKERLLMCGCPKTCKDPAPDCKGVCRVGCYCDEGEVRNDEGKCVALADCPPIKSAYTQDTTEPRANNGECPVNEEYRFCENCHRSCDNPNPICPAQCIRGCFCKDGLLRNEQGKCVKPEECKNVTTEPNIKLRMTCNSNQVYKQCETCEKTCSEPNPKCPTPCVTGCFCSEGFVKAPSGQCVKLEDCPKAEMSLGNPQTPTIEDCAPDEEYFSCGWCEPSCSYPQPTCPHKMCTTGCLCRPPLLRHHSGHCVEQKNCNAQKCTQPGEEYVCRYGCEARCGPRRFCMLRARRCVLGCHCKLGLYRETATGLCVTKDQCSNDTVTEVPISQNTVISVFNYSEPVWNQNVNDTKEN
ncbi:von Willebrand factor-like isoform X1 [Anticarsia gemmatalis]|uniref:von Willebrand factor-like isoform X1 n=1 Tax=Anticarsia gemmatalis TaxID=129554 RepID=UPI003F7692FB